MSTPDVSVVVAVYNTMPYLTACLESLVTQSIGTDRMEIVAVDDGSTDGSGAELDRFAARYPDTVTVLHQANSGGPAAPSNRALARVTGRYVFFVGADDFLGTEALERLVSTADRLGSDVVLGKLVGANGRYVNQKIFAGNQTDITMFDSPLPWALSNTKLFRRELLERHGLRFREDLAVCSDQPFTFEACLRAARISVLADYDFYHAVRRHDASNLTYNTAHDVHLHAIEAIMDFVAERVEPGKQRDAVLVRHFSWEVSKLLRDDFLRLERPTQQRVQAGIRALADRYLTDDIRHELPLKKRVRLVLAQCGELDDLLAAIRRDDQPGSVPLLTEGGRAYARYPGFRDPRLGLSDSMFELTTELADVAVRFELSAAAWQPDGDGSRALELTARSPVPDLPALLAGPVVVTAGPLPVTVVSAVPDDTGMTIRARIDLQALLAADPQRGFWSVKVEVTVGERTSSAPLRVPRPFAARRAVVRRGLRLYVVTATRNHKGRLVVAVAPLTVGRIIDRVRRTARQGGKQQP